MGKSTLFNRLCGERLALVDKTPGLTRDRREGITDLFNNVPVRLVDTAGYEGTTSEETLERRQLNKQMVNDMLTQTRNALIYSDLAIFLLDTRAGITQNDVMLYKWLTEKDLRIGRKQETSQSSPIEDLEYSLEFDERIAQVLGEEKAS